VIHKIDIGNIVADVVLKDIKNIHLSVFPPSGRVRISAPSRMDLETIRIFAISKLSWIKKQQTKIQQQERESQRDFTTRESHYFLGKRYLLQVIEADSKPFVTIKHNLIVLTIRPDSNVEQKQVVLQEWYRDQLKPIVSKLIEKWSQVLNVTVKEFGIKRMKTKWGTCNHDAQRIWLNLELAKKPLECIEYIVVHEMVHLLERNHNAYFIAYMDKFIPQWQHIKSELNRLPLSHAEWKY
jgi:predicted metal-dependent hydrolase